MPNQVVFQILITLLEVHYLWERAQTIIKAAVGKGLRELTTVATGRTTALPRSDIGDEAAYVQGACVIVVWKL